MIPVLAIVLTVAVVAVVVVDCRSIYAPASAGFAPSVSLLLARVEGARLLRHPLVWLAVLGAAFTFPFGNSEDWAVRWGLTGAYMVAVAGAGFGLAHLAASRDRRSGTDELTASLPTGQATRIHGHLLSSLWLTLPITVLWTVFVWWRLSPSGAMTIADGSLSFRWEPALLELAQGPMMLLTVLLLGVAAGVWWRHAAVAVIVPLLLFFSPLVWMLPLAGIEAGPIAPYLQNRVVDVGADHLPWHYVFMAGLALLGIAAAMLRRGSRRVWGSVAALATVALWAGFLLRRHEWFGM